jgi:phosphoenolpyruvate carboxykinase (GTP)
VADPEYDNPRGVPISAILFGGRRPSVVPLVFEAFNWAHGTFLGSIQSSETTAAQAGAVGIVRRDPMAMLPFCGYNMGDYLAHWLKMGRKTSANNLPKIFYVNWFRKSAEGKWLWPGYGENSRVLKWVYERVTGTGPAVETPLGYLPPPSAMEATGLDVSREDLQELLRVDRESWRKEIPDIRAHYAKLGSHLPKDLPDELARLEQGLSTAGDDA